MSDDENDMDTYNGYPSSSHFIPTTLDKILATGGNEFHRSLMSLTAHPNAFLIWMKTYRPELIPMLAEAIGSNSENSSGFCEVEASEAGEPEKRKLYLCSDCDFFTSVLGGMKNHKRACTGEKKFSNKGRKLYVCADCDFSTADFSEMKVHEKIPCAGDGAKVSVSCQTEARVPLLVISPASTDKVSTYCQTEDQNLTSTPLVVMARPCSVTKDQDGNETKCKVTVSCQTDDIKFPDKKIDMRADCPHCSYTATNKANLKIHLRTHTGERPHACTYCDKKFSLKSNLETHIRVHTGQRPFICEVCNKSFASKSVLARHRIRWHTEERPYVCEICFMGFKFRPDLKHHKKTHNFG